MANATTTLDPVEELNQLKSNFDAVFVLVNGVVVSLMQAGFACLEAGSVHSKNTANIIMKNFLDLFICGVAYYLVGYALAYGAGDNPYLGTSYWANTGLPSSLLPHWFFQFIFSATATTILSGAVAERCNFASYIIYSPIISGVTYPVVSHWAWAEKGWLLTMGYSDFAGSGAVHAFSGVCSFVAAAFLGPRMGRFGPDGQVNPLPGHSLTLVGVGALLIITGFLSFNGGTLSHASHPHDGDVIARSMCNTVMAGSGAAVVSLLLGKLGVSGTAPWPFSYIINATLAGMVAVCAGVDKFTFWAAMTVGAIGCVVYTVLHYLILAIKVDDPLDTTALHFGAGMWGVIAMPLFTPGGVLFTGSKESFRQLGYNVAGGLIICVWAGLTSIVIFGILKAIGIFRVSPEEEMKGLDETKHGEISYPVEAWQWEILRMNLENGVGFKKEIFKKKDFENFGFEMERQEIK